MWPLLAIGGCDWHVWIVPQAGRALKPTTQGEADTVLGSCDKNCLARLFYPQQHNREENWWVGAALPQVKAVHIEPYHTGTHKTVQGPALGVLMLPEKTSLFSSTPPSLRWQNSSGTQWVLGATHMCLGSNSAPQRMLPSFWKATPLGQPGRVQGFWKHFLWQQYSMQVRKVSEHNQS